MPEKTQLQCACGTVVDLVVPDPVFINRIQFTMVMFSHEKPARCPNCRKAFVYGISQIQITQAGFMATDIPEEPTITAPPPGFDPTKWKQ